MNGGTTVSVEQSLEGELSSEWRSITEVIPDPECPMTYKVRMIDIVKPREADSISFGEKDGLKIRPGDDFRM